MSIDVNTILTALITFLHIKEFHHDKNTDTCHVQLGAGFDALGLALTYYNYIEMEECDKIDITAADGLDIPTDERNLIYISAKDLFAVCGKKLEGLKLIQTSNIPMARGLGSSSACIIAGLLEQTKCLEIP